MLVRLFLLAGAMLGLLLSARALTLMNESYRFSPKFQENPALLRSLGIGTDP